MSEYTDELDEIVGSVAEPDEPVEAPDDSETVTEDAAAAAEPEGEARAVEPEQTVPLAALHEAREQNRELRERLERRDARMDEIERRIQASQEQAEEAPEPEIPDFMEDPKAYVDAKLEQLQGKVAQNEEKAEETQQVVQQTEAQRRQNEAIIQDNNRFVAANPDYPDALNYVRGVQYAEFLDAGYSEQQAVQAIQQSERSMAISVMQNGKSPAEIMYARAQRWGFSGGEAPAAEGSAEEAVTEEEDKDIEDAASMGSGGVPSIKDLIDANEDEFDQMFKELGYGDKMG